MADSGSITAWVTDLTGAWVCDLPHAPGDQALRGFRFRKDFDTGSGSLEYKRGSAIVAANPTIFDPRYSHLIWMAYPLPTSTPQVWIVEQSSDAIDQGEGQWVTVAGRGVRQLLARRRIYPTAFIDDDLHLDQSQWASQFQSVVTASVDDMIATLISDSNARFETQFSMTSISVEEYWTQDLRFNVLLDLIKAVEAAYGGFFSVGATLGGTPGAPAWDLSVTYLQAGDIGTDRSGSVVFQEGADITAIEEFIDARDKATWLISEGGTSVSATRPLAVSRQAGAAFRAEGFYSDPDIGIAEQLQLASDSALVQNEPTISVPFDAKPIRYLPLRDYDVGDTVGAQSSDQGISVAERVEAIEVAEPTEGDVEEIKVHLELGLAKETQITRLAQLQQESASQLSAVTRTPIITNWTAPGLLNSWANFGGGYAPAGYLKDAAGFVHLRGSIKSGTLTAAAFNLPVGYRPPYNENFAAVSNSAFGLLIVTSTGDVIPYNGSNVSFSLEGIIFFVG